VAELATFSPNTTQPLLTRRFGDLAIIRRIFEKSQICWNVNDKKGPAKAWVAMTSSSFSAHYLRLIDFQDSAPDESQIIVHKNIRYVPLIESKQIDQFCFSSSTYEGLSQEEALKGNTVKCIHGNGQEIKLPMPRFWAEEAIVKEFTSGKGISDFAVVYRDVTNVNNERTAIAAIIPSVGILQPLNGISCFDAVSSAIVLAAVNSFVCDFIARLRFTGRHLNVTTFMQLPIPLEVDKEFILKRVIELVYCGPALKSFATNCGFEGPPFKWDDSRRFIIRCELDAAFAIFYGLSEGDMDYVMNTFTVLKARDEKKYGSYNTKDMVIKSMSRVRPLLRNFEKIQLLS
jgi:hypothetical protein